ncbi:thiamine diphosphokinase [Paenibacillus sp. DXFW5]|uniref:Thiamine diphosphokinase n=1 Tax=Paenibacillus rhizolycopersici TaxID=2780073 RepID=A0ABS2H9D5_9BACL|nr:MULTISPECIES: thiamine diphosphokinase [Paenibacillus]MBM6996399.1 thiamine diphosphokinase [Paenibacillus rhizolycopersici]MUG86154.1 thiamine diphosphokinase [Paenibacillus timonensis]
MTVNRVLIFAGGRLDPGMLREVRPNDFLIGADRGALFLVEHGMKPDLAVGDFDSVSEEELERIRTYSIELLACDPVDKDLTDTELAFDHAVRRNPAEIVLTGVIGTRLDHTLANLHMLLRAAEQGITCAIWDEYNYITLCGSFSQVEDRGYSYVSLLPLTPVVTGITLDGFMYPLHNATLRIGQSLAVSNQLVASTGTVHVGEGWLLIIQSRD